MAKFTVTLHRVITATTEVNAQTAKHAREIINQDGAHEWIISSGAIERSDLTTIAKVTRA